MATISVTPMTVRQVMQEEVDIANSLRRLMGGVDGVRNGLRYKIAGREAISTKLRDAASQIEREMNGVTNLRKALEQALNAYERTENGNRDALVPNVPVKSSINTASGGVGAGLAGFGLSDTGMSGTGGIGTGFSNWERLGLTPDRIREVLKNVLKGPPTTCHIPPFLWGSGALLFPAIGAIAASVGNSGSTLEMPHWKGGSSVLAGSGTAAGSLLGFATSGSASGDVLGWSYDVSPSKAKIEGHLAQGKLSGSVGALSGSISGNVGQVSAEGSVGASLYDKGQFRPNISAEAKAEATALSGKAEAQLGSDEFNAHVGASGKVLTAEAKAGVKAGMYKTTDSDGNEITAAGIKAEAGAEAYVASGKVSGGFTLFGIKIDASLKGHVGAGATVGGEVSSSHAALDLGAALGLGVGVSVKIDWSNFKFGW